MHSTSSPRRPAGPVISGVALAVALAALTAACTTTESSGSASGAVARAGAAAAPLAGAAAAATPLAAIQGTGTVISAATGTAPASAVAGSTAGAATPATATSATATLAAFDIPDPAFKGRVSLVDTPIVLPGSAVQLGGRDFKPGQQVRLSYGGQPLGSGEPIVVGADGSFRARFTVPADAPVGQHPVVVSASNPAAALIHPLKVSPDIPLSGQDRFTVTSQKLVPGLYQAAYSARHDRLFVTAAVGRPPVSESRLLKIDPATLATEASVAPPAVPARPAATGEKPREAGLYAVYGVAVDDTKGTVWVTNTRQDTVAVYRQSDLGLVKQFPIGAADHARDVVVDETLGKAYVSSATSNVVVVFDTRTLKRLRNIEIATTVKGPDDPKFTPMSLDLDRGQHKLYTVGLSTSEAAIIDTRSDKVEKVFPVEGTKYASGVAFDPKTNRLLVASQGTDNLVIVDAATQQTLSDVRVGAGSLNVAVDHQRGLAYVPNRGAGTVTVVSLDGRIVANLPGGTFPNHVTEDGKGSIYAINKSRGADDAQGDRITRITPR